MYLYKMTVLELSRASVEATMMAVQLMPDKPEFVNLLFDIAELANMEMFVRTSDKPRAEAEAEFRASDMERQMRAMKEG